MHHDRGESLGTLPGCLMGGLLASPLPGISSSISGLCETRSTSISSESTDTVGAGNSNPNVQDLPKQLFRRPEWGFKPHNDDAKVHQGQYK